MTQTSSTNVFQRQPILSNQTVPTKPIQLRTCVSYPSSGLAFTHRGGYSESIYYSPLFFIRTSKFQPKLAVLNILAI